MRKSKSTDRKSTKVSISSCSRIIGIDKGQLSRESREPGFPMTTVDGKKVCDPEEVKAWRRRNKSSRAKKADVKARTVAAESPPSDQKTKLVLLLKSSNVSGLERSRAAMDLASLQLAEAAEKNIAGPNDYSSLNKSLGELRQAESDYVDLEEKRGQLIPRDVVKATAGMLISRLVQCVGILENSISLEFAIWLADPKIQQMSSDDRARKVREFVATKCREVRESEADSIDSLVAAAKEEM